jgi:uncharacterized protein
MRIDASKIPAGGLDIEGEDPAEILAVEDHAGDFKVEGPVHYRLHAYVSGGELVVAGTLETRVSFQCSRCAEAFAFPIREKGFEFVHELAAADESVDLTSDMREVMLLAFPAYPVCRNDCRGLCPQCGTNLNKDKCKCKPTDFSAWNALDRIKL